VLTCRCSAARVINLTSIIFTQLQAWLAGTKVRYETLYFAIHNMAAETKNFVILEH